MRRSPWFRALATALAVWFPLVAGEPGVLQPCPMHGAGPAVAALLRHASAPAPSHMHAQHAEHMAHGKAQHTAPDHSAPGHDHHHTCCCIGCCTASLALTAPRAPTGEIAAREFDLERVLPTVESLARPAPHFARPYTTGPPPSRLA